MRYLVLLVWWGTVAHADPTDEHVERALTLGAGEDTIDRDAQATVSAGAAIGASSVEHFARSEARAEATTELRSGSSTELAGDANAHWTADYDAGAGVHVPILGVWIDTALGKRPALDARRDVEREAFAQTSIGFRLAPLFAADADRRVGALRFGFGGDRMWQGAARRAQITAEFELVYFCRLASSVPTCVHVFEVDGTGVSGAKRATVTNISFARATGLAGHFEIGIGMISDGVAIGNNAALDGPDHVVMTEDLPHKNVLAGSAGAVAFVGPVRVDVRGARTGYVSLDHDLSIEDRATLSATLGLADHASLAITGFTAHTRWWSSAMDPGSAASTGGGDIGVTARVHRFDVKAGAGVAQSFYPTLDGGAVAAPAVGFRSTLQLARTIDL